MHQIILATAALLCSAALMLGQSILALVANPQTRAAGVRAATIVTAVVFVMAVSIALDVQVFRLALLAFHAMHAL